MDCKSNIFFSIGKIFEVFYCRRLSFGGVRTEVPQFSEHKPRYKVLKIVVLPSIDAASDALLHLETFGVCYAVHKLPVVTAYLLGDEHVKFDIEVACAGTVPAYCRKALAAQLDNGAGLSA